MEDPYRRRAFRIDDNLFFFYFLFFIFFTGQFKSLNIHHGKFNDQ